MRSSISIRPASPEDSPAIARIYAAAVLQGTATFDLEPPTEASMRQRLHELTNTGFPYLVADDGRHVLGYAYAAPFRLRAAYASTVEDSVYIAEEARGLRVGKQLLTALIDTCEALDMRSMLALIGDSASAASIGLHRSCGFSPAGTLRAVGYKHGRWLDVVLMERSLGPGPRNAPTRP